MDSQSSAHPTCSSQKVPRQYTKRIHNEEFMALRFVRQSIVTKNNTITKLKDQVISLKAQVISLKMECNDKSNEIEKLLAEFHKFEVNHAMAENQKSAKLEEHKRAVDARETPSMPSSGTIEVMPFENIHNINHMSQDMPSIVEIKTEPKDEHASTSHDFDNTKFQALLDNVSNGPIQGNEERSTIRNTPAKGNRSRPKRKSAVRNPFCNAGGLENSNMDDMFLAGDYVYVDESFVKDEYPLDTDNEADSCRSKGRKRQKRQPPFDASPRRTRRYPCSNTGCDMVFDRPSNLERHLNSVHTGARPHKCPDPACGADYPRKDSLLLHMRARHPHLLTSCKEPLCTCLFLTQRGALVHEKIYHPKNRQLS